LKKRKRGKLFEFVESMLSVLLQLTNYLFFTFSLHFSIVFLTVKIENITQKLLLIDVVNIEILKHPMGIRFFINLNYIN
jgi:hypothetical protein